MSRNPVSSANVFGHPIHPMLIPFPIVFFISTLLTDIGFSLSRSDAWYTASLWLLGAGLTGAAAAAIADLIDFLGDHRIRKLGAAWRHAIGNVLAVVISLGSFFWRFVTGPEAILPGGIILSAIVAGILVYTGWQGGSMVYEHQVAVYDEPPTSADG